MVNKAKVKEFQCRHEEHCSQPGTYWRYNNHVCIMDKNGNTIEDVVSPPGMPDCAVCTECGAGAELRYPKEEKGEEEKLQQALL